MSIFTIRTSRWLSQAGYLKKYAYPWHKRPLRDSGPVQKLVCTRCISTKSKNFAGESEWKGIFMRFLPVGLCLIAVMQWRVYRRWSSDKVAKQWEINCYCLLPLRTVSRWWGWLADKQLPVYLRAPVYKLYSNTFGVDISEALHEDLTFYPCLGDFFARPLKEGVRQIDENCCLVSPCDGTLLHFATVNTDQVEQVKGVTYSLRDFLGEIVWKKHNNNNNTDFRTSLLHQPHIGNTLYQCVIYLAPGDYHRFHSPTEWKPTHRRHFSGQLLSVSPGIAKWLPGLFCLNERVVYLGHWEHGFFAYIAVGATNVGTVKVYFDKTLQTNIKNKMSPKEVCLGNSIDLRKGDPMGEFRMGSTIVLIFEAPIHFNFSVLPGEHIKMGQSLGNVGHHKFVDRIDKNKTNGKGAS